MGLFGSKVESKCLVVGLDNSGKSTIVNSLKPEKMKDDDIQATVGLSTQKFKYLGTQFTMFDMSGARQYRNLWETFYDEAQGIIFVVDSADRVRVCVAKDELEELMDHKSIKGRPLPVLIFANKRDLSNALSTQELTTAMGLNKLLMDRPWKMVASNALNGTGVEEGVKWLSAQLKQKESKKK